METVRQPPAIANFELVREIGSSPEATVWLARAPGLDEDVALKIIDLGAFGNPGIANALQRECGMVATLSHDNVIRLHDYGVAGRNFYLAMELLEEGDLAERIADGMGWQDALTVARSISDALSEAHAHGIVHRDLRPSNVLFAGDGRPVLSDFGIGRIIERESQATRPLSARSLPSYVAPEQIEGLGATPRSDIYALGVILFEMLVGKLPFRGENPREVEEGHLHKDPPELPDGCSEVAPLIRRMLAKAPAERPENAKDVADELQRIVEGAGGATVPRGNTRIQAGEIGGSTVVQSGQSTVVQSGFSTVAQPRHATIGDTWTQEQRTDMLPTIGVGSLVRDRFKIEAVLGEGGMGAVYYALDLLKQEAGDDDPYVALKVMHPQIATAELTFMALQREAKRAQDLAHPNIVTVYDLDRVEGVVYMTMELLRGEDSEHRVVKHPEGLEPEEARSIVNDVTAGLAYAHTRGITHADLKPQNVFLADDGRAKLLDFGIARAHAANKPDAIEEIFSGYTPAYASPEILGGEKAMPSDDVYALGCIAYFYFTGRHPFDKRPATEARDLGLKPKRPRNMRRAEWRAVSAALRFDGSKRPRDASEFAKRFSPSRVKQTAIAVSTVATAAALAIGLMLGDRQGPEIPFDELPPETQAQINQNLEDARVFLDSGDVNAALQLYDSVLETHPGNQRATEGMTNTVDRVLARMKRNLEQGAMDQGTAQAALDTLLSYKTLPESARENVRETRAQL